MKSPFESFVKKQVRIELRNGETHVGKLSSAEDMWLTLDEGGEQHVLRADDVRELRAEKASNAKYLFNVRIGRITVFDPESNMGHIRERGTGRDWSFSGDAIRDEKLDRNILAGKTGQLVKFIPATDFSRNMSGGSDADAVKAVSHHALRTKSGVLRWIYEITKLIWLAFVDRGQRLMQKEGFHRGVVFDFNRRKGAGRIREDGTESVWSFYGNDIADRNVFNRIYAGELGMHVAFSGFKHASPGKISDAHDISELVDSSLQTRESSIPEVRTASGRITAYYVDRGFGFVKEAQSEQVWFFSQKSIVVDMQLQESLMRGELNQFVTFSGRPQPTPGHEYPAVDTMHSAQAHGEPLAANSDARGRRQPNGGYPEARAAEQHGNFQLAEDIYRKILQDPKDPARPVAVKGYAHLLNRLNRADEAIDLVEANKALFDAKSRLGMLSIFCRKARRYLDAADVLRQMALNIGLPRDDEKRISYLFQGAECFCEGRDFVSAQELLGYLPPEFDRNDPRYVTTMSRIDAGSRFETKDAPESAGEKPGKRDRGFQYPELAKDRLAACRYVGLSQERQAEGTFRKSDITAVSSLLRGSPGLPPSVAADYYLTMAKISDDIGESAMANLYKHFLFTAVDAVYGLETNPPRATEEEALCDVVQGICCAGNNRFFHERLWSVAVWAFCGPQERLPIEGLRKKFEPGSLIRTALDRLRPHQEACDRFFQTLGLVRRNVPEEGFAFLIESLKAAGWVDCEETISRCDRYAGVEGPFSDVLELENMDERSLIEIRSNLRSVGDLPSSADRQSCEAFSDLLGLSADYASRQSSFVRCTEVFNQLQPRLQMMIERIKTSRSVLSVCLLRPAVRHLMGLIEANYSTHKAIKPELLLDLKYDDPESRACVITDGKVTLRFNVRAANEAAPPVHNLQFAVLGEETDSVPRTEYMWPENFTGAPVDFVLPAFRLSDGESAAGEFSIALSVRFDTLLNEHCDGKYAFAVKLASEQSTWEEIHPNPYADAASGSQISDDKMFFGRRKLVADIAEVLRRPNGGQCFALYGQKRSGKSSVLEAVCRRLIRTEEKCIISSISAQALVVKGSKGALFARFALMLASRLKTEFLDHRLPIPGDFPTTTEIYDNPMDAVERFVRTIRGEGYFWIVTIDEFTSIHQESPEVVDSFMHNWKAMLQDHFFNALIVGQDTMPKFMDEHPNDFCISHNIRLSYLAKDECRELASNPIEFNGKTRYLESSLDKVFDWTLGSPYLVQKFCFRLVKRLNDNKRTYVVDADIDGVAKGMCSGGDGLQRMPEVEFDSFVTAGDENWADYSKDVLMRALVAVAKESRITGWAPVDCIVRDGENGDGSDAIPVGAIEDLVKRDALERRDGKLRVPVRLFAEWLRTNM